jgi:predicted DNA-binding protein
MFTIRLSENLNSKFINDAKTLGLTRANYFRLIVSRGIHFKECKNKDDISKFKDTLPLVTKNEVKVFNTEFGIQGKNLNQAVKAMNGLLRNRDSLYPDEQKEYLISIQDSLNKVINEYESLYKFSNTINTYIEDCD